MEIFDVAIVGGGPAGSSCAAFCAHAGVQTIVLEREKFPREKVCGDCLNPACWPVLERLDLAQHVRALPQANLDLVRLLQSGGEGELLYFHSSIKANSRSKGAFLDISLLNAAAESASHISTRPQ